MQYIIYPLTMSLAYCLLWFFQEEQLSPNLISYSIGIIVAILVAAFEFRLFFRQKWHPKKSDVVSDSLFMVFVQILLPYLLSLGFLSLIHSAELSINLWPRHFPVWLQTIYMLVGAELLRYWLT